MWELDWKEGWASTNWCFQIVVLEKTLKSSLDSQEIKLVSPKGNQPWIFTGRTDAEAEAAVLWPPDAKGQLIGKDPDAGKDWGQGEKGVAEEEMEYIESRKLVLMNLSAGKECRHRCGEWPCGHSGAGEGAANGESCIGTCPLSGVRWRAGEKVLWSAGSLILHSLMTWRARMGRREGGHVCIIMADSHCCMAEANTTL